MEHIARSIKDLCKGLETGEIMPPLEDLVSLPSTEDLRVMVRRTEGNLERARGCGHPLEIEARQKAVARAVRDVKQGEYRDQVQATRPEGCWCLGAGGRHPQHRYTEEGQEIKEFVEYCTCPEAKQIKAETERIKRAADTGRRKVALNWAWDKAGFPSRLKQYSLATYPSSPHTKALVKQLMCPPELPDDWTDEQLDQSSDLHNAWTRSWFLWGPYGRGKTGLAIGYALEWLRYQVRIESPNYITSKAQVLFRSVPDLLSELRDTYKSQGESEGAVIRRYSDVPLLILDDMGAEHVKDTGWIEDRMYQMIGRRHGEDLTTVFTSNLSLEQLAARIGERVTWRIVEMCGSDHIVCVDGPNLRDK